MPVMENYEYTAQAIADIRKHTRQNYEIILIDNGSGAKTKAKLLKLLTDDDKFLSFPDNYGFPRAMNYGVGIATGEYIVLMNNDVRLPAKWLDKLLAPFSDYAVGVSSPIRTIVDKGVIRLLRPSGHPPTMADLPYVKGREAATVAKINKKQEEQGAGVFYTDDMVAFFCVALSRRAIDTVGYFDEDFGLGLCEDNYFCRLLLNNGFKIAINTELFCLHLTSQTIRKIWPDDIGVAAIGENSKLLTKKLHSGVLNTHAALRPIGVV